jgi:hypothetical protein
MQDLVHLASNFYGSRTQRIGQSANIDLEEACSRREGCLSLRSSVDFASFAISKERDVTKVQDSCTRLEDPVDVTGAEPQELKGGARKE